MSYKAPQDISTFNIAGISVLNDLRGYNISFDNTDIDSSVITQYGQRHQAGQRTVTLDATCTSGIGTGSACATKTWGTNLSVMGVGGTSYLTTFKTVTMNINAEQDDVSGGADVFKSHQNQSFDITADITAMVPTASAHAWFTLLRNPSASMSATWSMTLAGEEIVLPMTILKCEYGSQGKNTTEIKLNLAGFPACTGSFPTTATTNTLMGLLYSDPITPVNVEFASAASNGEIIDMDMVWASGSFTVEKDNIVEFSYQLKSTGVPSGTIS